MRWIFVFWGWFWLQWKKTTMIFWWKCKYLSQATIQPLQMDVAAELIDWVLFASRQISTGARIILNTSRNISISSWNTCCTSKNISTCGWNILSASRNILSARRNIDQNLLIFEIMMTFKYDGLLSSTSVQDFHHHSQRWWSLLFNGLSHCWLS